MKPLFKNLSTELVTRNIRPSFQRIKVLEYLINKPIHPTADQIFKDLQFEVQTLSKTTIYNTLNLFLEANLVRAINIEDHETRYDIVTETHGHFKCEECGRIFNFNTDIDKLMTEELSGFKIYKKDVYFKGVCPKCLSNINHYDQKERSL